MADDCNADRSGTAPMWYFRRRDTCRGPDGAFTAYLSPAQALSYEGHVYASRVGSAIVGRLDGAIELYEKSPVFYRPIGQCRGGNHRFSMTAAPAGATR